MMFSQTTEYALRAVVWLAEKQGTAQTTQEIATAAQIPLGYLAKVLQTLSRAGLVTALRGKRGGFELAKPPSSISVLEIINVIEPIRRIRTCPLNLESHGQHLCALHRKIDDALASIESSFAKARLSDLISTRVRRPLCEIVQPKKRRIGNAQ